MSHPQTTTALPWAAVLPWRAATRWTATFAAFPLGSVVARAFAGPVDGPVAALAGGVVTGLAVGAAQAWALGEHRPPVAAWVAATGAGLGIGLALGAGLVGFATDARSLTLQGALTGAAVGLAQAAVLLRTRRTSLALLWPVLLGGAYALGWTVTTAVGVEVDAQFTVFGSSGAALVALLTLVLPAALRRDAEAVQS